MTPERLLRKKLRKIEALFAGAATEGERVAAGAAADRRMGLHRRFESVERHRLSGHPFTQESAKAVPAASCGPTRGILNRGLAGLPTTPPMSAPRP